VLPGNGMVPRGRIAPHVSASNSEFQLPRRSGSSAENHSLTDIRQRGNCLCTPLRTPELAQRDRGGALRGSGFAFRL
jgi:hypothetical protein